MCPHLQRLDLLWALGTSITCLIQDLRAPLPPPNGAGASPGLKMADAAAVVASLVANGHSGHDITKLLAFCSQEMHLFFAHIHASTQHFQQTGEVPHSIFSGAREGCED